MAHRNHAADPKHTLTSSCPVLSPRTAEVTTAPSKTKQAAHTQSVAWSTFKKLYKAWKT